MTTHTDPTVLRDDLMALKLFVVDTFREDCFEATGDGERYRRAYAEGTITLRHTIDEQHGLICHTSLIATWPDGKKETVCTIKLRSTVPEAFDCALEAFEGDVA